MTKTYKIAIDGPSGTGKSTMARMLAKELGFIYIDTGALYRTVGLHVYRCGYSSEDIGGIIDSLSSINMRLVLIDGVGTIMLGDEKMTDQIRTPQISIYASNVSKVPEVREFLLDFQQKTAQDSSVILDGRDIGTVIFPDADVKFFMTTDEKVRAQRRWKELTEKGENVTFEQVLHDVIWRDKNDSERKIAPAVPAEDAVLFDNTSLDIDECFKKMLCIIKDKLSLTTDCRERNDQK